MKTRRLFDIYMKNITNASIINSGTVLLKIYLTDDEVSAIHRAINSKFDAEWVFIPGRAILKVDEIKRIVRVYEDER